MRGRDALVRGARYVTRAMFIATFEPQLNGVLEPNLTYVAVTFRDTAYDVTDTI